MVAPRHTRTVMERHAASVSAGDVVAVFNDDGLLTSLRAFYSLDDLRAV